ncbi:MAG: TonB-dependent receptor domain-containing protein [Acidobacteriota bacterium]
MFLLKRCFGALVFVWPLFSQAIDGSLSGTVRDPSQAGIRDARVSLENPATTWKIEATTDALGSYLLNGIPPGTYRLKVSRGGFLDTEIRHLVVNIGDRKILDLILNVAGPTESLTVIEEALGLVESATVATVVDRRFVENLPMNGRTFQNLIALSPGVTQTSSTARNPGQFSVNGQRTSSNYLTVDGVSGNFGLPAAPALAGSFDGTLPALTSNGGTNSLVSVDAMQEFQVQTSTFAPEFGRTPGGQIAIVTRSGTNNWHGTLFNYFRNEKLDANDWFANRDALPRAPIRQNNFGGVLGGPLFVPRVYNGRNRSFFFLSHEELRLRQPQFATDAYPTLAIRNLASPANRPLLDSYPIPNQGDLGGGFGRFATTYSNPSTLFSTSLRLDHRFSNSISLWGRFVESPSEAGYRGSVQSYDLSLNSISRNTNDARMLTIGSTQTLSARFLNESRLNYSRSRGSFTSRMDELGGAKPFSAAQLFPSFASPDSGAVGILPQGLRGFAVGSLAANGQNQWNFTDTASYLAGRHQLKFGVDYRRLTPLVESPLYQQFGVFAGLQGPVGILTGRTATVIVSAYENMRALTQNFSAFAQDTWRPNDRLSLTFGLRWELNPALAATNRPLYTATTSDPRTAQLSGPNASLFPTQWNALAPRFGLSFQLGRRAGFETTLRGGLGLFYDLPLGGLQALSSNPPYRRTRRLSGTVFPLPEAQAAPLPLSTSPPFDDVAVYDENYRLSHTTQFNFTIDQGWGQGRFLTLSYVGALGRKLQRRESFAGTPGSAFRGFSVFRADAASDFHSLQTQLRQTLRHGLQWMLSHSWSHAIDTASDNVAFNPPLTALDSPRANRGPSDFDVRQNFNAALSWDLPFRSTTPLLRALTRDWGLDSILRAQSGFPIDIFSRAVINGATFQFRPDALPGQPLSLAGPGYPGGRIFNRAAFAIPANQVRNGSLGRNALRGFPLHQIDLTARRGFALTERIKLQFRAEFFNLLNQPSFGNPDGFLLNPLFGFSTQMFGRALGLGGVNGGLNPLYTMGGPRSTQLALKIQF